MKNNQHTSTRRGFLKALLLAGALVGALALSGLPASEQGAVSQLQAAEKTTYNVKDYGAVGDGKVLDTAAIQKAIDACAQAGGGEVLLPAPGTYLSGTIHLKDNITFRIEKDATLLGSTNIADYSNPGGSERVLFQWGDGKGLGPYCFVAIVDAKNVRLTGEGTIDGQGKADAFSQKTFHMSKYQRPVLIDVMRSANVEISNLRLRQAALWCVLIELSDQVAISGIDLFNNAYMNSDGFFIDSSRNILIEKCSIDSSDNCVGIHNQYASSCEHITVRECRMTSPAGAFRIGCETYGDIKNVRFTDNVIYDCASGAIQLFSQDGASVEDIAIDNIEVKNSAPIVYAYLGKRFLTFRKGQEKRHEPGHFKNVVISNIRAESSQARGFAAAPTGIFLAAADGLRIKDFALKNIRIAHAGGGLLSLTTPLYDKPVRGWGPFLHHFLVHADDGSDGYKKASGRNLPSHGILLRHAGDMIFENVTVIAAKPDERPFIYLDDVTDTKFIGCETNEGNGSFLQKKDCEGILVEANKDPNKKER